MKSPSNSTDVHQGESPSRRLRPHATPVCTPEEDTTPRVLSGVVGISLTHPHPQAHRSGGTPTSDPLRPYGRPPVTDSDPGHPRGCSVLPTVWVLVRFPTGPSRHHRLPRRYEETCRPEENTGAVFDVYGDPGPGRVPLDTPRPPSTTLCPSGVPFLSRPRSGTGKRTT